jgi:hypothetical protein
VLDLDGLELLLELELPFVEVVALCDAAPLDPLWDAAMAVPPPASSAAVAATARTDRVACIVASFRWFDADHPTGLH